MILAINHMKIIIFTIIAVASILFWISMLKNDSGNKSAHSALLSNTEITVYKSPTCGCCGNYISYLKKQGAKVAVQETEKMKGVKTRNKIPALLESCHTSIVDGYVIEGHVPAEAIRKLLDEKPSIGGISLPEMPAGSPGMSGVKLAPFSIYTITSAGTDGGIFTEL